MNEMESFLIGRPCLSSELEKKIEKKFNITNVAARKRIERLKTPIHKITGMFQSNQSFLYHKNDYNSEVYYESLVRALRDYSKRYFAVLSAINYHYGFIHKDHLPVYSLSPVSGLKGHVLFKSIIEKSIKLGFIEDHDHYHYALSSKLSFLFPNINFQHYKAIEIAKKIILEQFDCFLKNTGFVSFNKGELYREFSKFKWCYSGPSYVNGIVNYINNKPIPGFVLVDVLIGNQTTRDDIDYFLQKIDIVRNSNPKIKFIPILLLDEVYSAGLSALKKSGVWHIFINEIFGKDFSTLLNTLINAVTNAGEILKDNPDYYIEFIEKLTKFVEGKTNNLRGDLFELAVGFYYGRFCQTLEIGKIIKNDFGKKEIDVFAVYENEIRIIECKGYNYPLDKVYVEEYLSKKIPFIREYFLSDRSFHNKKMVFEIWSTGGFDSASTELLKIAKSKTKKYTINYYNAKQIFEKSKEIDSTKFKEIMKSYYLKELL